MRARLPILIPTRKTCDHSGKQLGFLANHVGPYLSSLRHRRTRGLLLAYQVWWYLKSVFLDYFRLLLHTSVHFDCAVKCLVHHLATVFPFRVAGRWIDRDRSMIILCPRSQPRFSTATRGKIKPSMTVLLLISSYVYLQPSLGAHGYCSLPSSPTSNSIHTTTPLSVHVHSRNPPLQLHLLDFPIRLLP